MNRSGPLTRRAPMKRGGRIKRKSAKPREMERKHGTPEFRAWMKMQPCIICGRTPSDAAHIASGGTGRKDDVTRAIPLCSDTANERGHHSEYDGRKHVGGKVTFLKKYGLTKDDLFAAAVMTQARWTAHELKISGLSQAN